MKKEIALNILEDIKKSLQEENWREAGIKTVSLYRKNIEIVINKKINQLMDKHKEYIHKYGENNWKTIKLNKKIDKEIQKIFAR